MTPQELVTANSITPEISGSPLVAFYAQLNRFRKHAGQAEFPLAAGTITPDAAYTALLLLQARLVSGLVSLPDPAVLQEQQKLEAAMRDAVGYVSPRLVEVTQTLAIYGDLIGLPVAKVGITTSALRKKPNPAVILGLLALLGLSGWGAYRYWQRTKIG